MKASGAFGRRVIALVAVLSMASYPADLVPPPYNAALFGGGVALAGVIAQRTIKRRKSKPLSPGFDLLPGVPKKTGRAAPHTVTHALEREILLRKYDRAFSKLLSAQEASARLESLEALKPMIYDLPGEIRAWNGDVRLRMYLLMREMTRNISEPAFANTSLGILVLILSKGGGSAVEMARPMFSDKLHEMYAGTFRTDERHLPRLMLMLEGYREEHVTALARQAIHDWDDDRFRSAGEYLGFDQLRGLEVRDKLKAILRHEIAQAGLDHDRKALDRAISLYHGV
jgi:hypothetical protein